ncbi:ABC transporter ATP-binding protein [Plantibacter sp. YIM 135249]|uniref:ABC transporter ATP-binding protein n=1 Tax=Plantibacter sp. YIM 135249 TaxID=3423918 RepID=UPI003D32CFB9
MTLEIDRLTIDIGDRRVVDEVSLTVADGARFGIIGESGSGKSLTALAVLGLLPDGARVGGSIRWNGRELVGLSDREIARIRGEEIGIVFQEPRTALNPIRTIGRQMGEPLRIHHGASKREAMERAVELAERVRLPDPVDIVKRYPHQLSGGQRQRVATAIALANRPSLLIADEPTTALDVTIQSQILGLFERLVSETGASLVFITHDLAVLSRIATDAVVMSHGRIVEAGPVTQLLSAPVSPITQRLLAAATTLSWKQAGGADA